MGSGEHAGRRLRRACREEIRGFLGDRPARGVARPLLRVARALIQPEASSRDTCVLNEKNLGVREAVHVDR
jgi:hypothetical protein